jgi:hypothetical protein
MRQQISYGYEERDPVQEEREHQYWLDNLATKSRDLIDPIKPLDKPKGKTNETKQERTGNLGEQDARRDSDGDEASQQKQ